MKMAAVQFAVFSVVMFRDFMSACQIWNVIYTGTKKCIHTDTHSTALIILQCKDMEWLRWTDCTTPTLLQDFLLVYIISRLALWKASIDTKISLRGPENLRTTKKKKTPHWRGSCLSAESHFLHLLIFSRLASRQTLDTILLLFLHSLLMNDSQFETFWIIWWIRSFGLFGSNGNYG